MNFEFSDDQLVMKEEVRKLFEKEDSVKRNRNILEGDENFDKDLEDVESRHRQQYRRCCIMVMSRRTSINESTLKKLKKKGKEIERQRHRRVN